MTASVDALGFTSTAAYDAAGNLTKTTDPLGFVTTHLYDALDRKTETRDAAGGIATTTYDAVGNAVNTIDPVGDKTTFAYDARNQLTKTTDPEGGVLTYLYDGGGNRTGLIDPVGNRSTFGYDALNRQTAEIDPLGKTLTAAYDAAGRQTQTIDRLGRTRNYLFDAADRRTKETWVESSTTVNTLTFTYANAGNVLTALDKNGAYTHAYDAGGRVTRIDQPFAFSQTFQYDAAGNRTRVEDTFGAVATSVYDAANQLTSRRLGGSGTPLRLDQAWDGRGMLATVTRYSDVAGLTKVGESVYQYDGAGRATHVTHKDGTATTLSELTYTYDASGRLTTQVEDGSSTTYGYDRTDQLTNANATGFSYDANGNRTMTGYAVGAGNRMTNDGTWTYTYDDEGNRTKKSKGATLETWTFGYDHRNQMTWAEQRSTDGGTLLLKLEYKYDVVGRRLEEARWTSGTGTVTARHASDGADAVVDLDGSNAFAARYLRPDGLDALGGRVKAAGSAGFYLTDRQGTVKAITDATGTVIDRLTYDAYGRITAETSPSNGDRFGYTGAEVQKDTGLQQHDDRWYDTWTGRWVSEDPIRFRAGDASPTRYAGNGPTNGTDPTGRYLFAPDYDSLVEWAEWIRKRTGVVPLRHQLSSGWYYLAVRPEDEDAFRDGVRGAANFDAEELIRAAVGGDGGEWNANAYTHRSVKAGSWDLSPTNVTWEERSEVVRYNQKHNLGRVEYNAQQIHQFGMADALYWGAVGANDGALIMTNQITFKLIPGLNAEAERLIKENGGAYLWADVAGQVARDAILTVGPVGIAGGAALLAKYPRLVKMGNALAQAAGRWVRPEVSQGAAWLACKLVTGLRVFQATTLGQQVATVGVALTKAYVEAEAGHYEEAAKHLSTAGFGTLVLVQSTQSMLQMAKVLGTEGPIGLYKFLAACFGAGTRLRTPEGSKAIEEFREGDWVLSRDEDDPGGAVEVKVVEAVFARTGRVLHLHVGGEIIRTTPEHPFWVKGKGWVEAGRLGAGDLLSTEGGGWAAVGEAYDTGEYETVYNLRVADFHTYFVGDERWKFAVWAHNACTPKAVQDAAGNYGGAPKLTYQQADTAARLFREGKVEQARAYLSKIPHVKDRTIDKLEAQFAPKELRQN